jgi:hypothetical protein
MPAPPPACESSRASRDRRHIAFGVLIASGAVLIVICGTFIWVGAEQGGRSRAAEMAFATLIPLIGTWVGTVLAYYFSGENFQRLRFGHPHRQPGRRGTPARHQRHRGDDSDRQGHRRPPRQG